MRCRFLLAVVLMSGVAVANVRADEAQEAKAIVEKAIAATGGLEKLSKYEAMTWSEKGKFYGMGSGGMEYTGTYAAQYPSKFKMNIKDVFTIVLNGDQGWSNMAGGGAMPLSAEQLEETKEQNHAGWVSSLVPLLEKEYRLTKLDPIEIDGQQAIGVKASRDGHRDVKLYFDGKTHRLAKVEYMVKAEDQGGKEVKQEEFHSGYQEIEGMQVPSKMKILRDGEKFIESEHTDMKLFEKLPDETFAKPE